MPVFSARQKQVIVKKFLWQKSTTAIKQLAWAVSPTLFERLFEPQHPQTFSIGILHGSSPLDLQHDDAVSNPVLKASDVTDAPAGFVADPFMIKDLDTWYMFMEVYDRILRRGRIGLAVSKDCKSWRYQQLVVEEDFHLAYPQVFSQDADHFMVPDSPGKGVRLYRATEFPVRWKFERTLIDDPNIVDPTPFHFDGLWWLIAGWQDPFNSKMSLRLYHAPNLDGPWIEHTCSPIVHENNRISRPSGSVVNLDGRLIRFAQDGEPEYGSRVHAIEITKLTTTGYEEQQTKPTVILDAGSEHWNSSGMHHICAHRLAGHWIACVDGWYRSDKS